MKYVALKTELLKNINELLPNDFYLLEGKLIFKSKQKANVVKKYLDKQFDVIQVPVHNWSHWQSKYESILYFKNLQKESNG